MRGKGIGGPLGGGSVWECLFGGQWWGKASRVSPPPLGGLGTKVGRVYGKTLKGRGQSWEGLGETFRP